LTTAKEKEANAERKERLKKEREKERKRSIFFCVGYSKFWKVPVHAIIKKLKDKHGMKWLRFSMSYHKFSNLREIFQGDLSAKVMKGVESKDFMDRNCNCNNKTKINGRCAYGGKCRKACIVYAAECKICTKTYIGVTQGYMKNSMGPHLGDVKRLVSSGKKSDSFCTSHGQTLQRKRCKSHSSNGQRNGKYGCSMARESNQLHEIIRQAKLQTVHERTYNYTQIHERKSE